MWCHRCDVCDWMFQVPVHRMEILMKSGPLWASPQRIRAQRCRWTQMMSKPFRCSWTRIHLSGECVWRTPERLCHVTRSLTSSHVWQTDVSRHHHGEDHREADWGGHCDVGGVWSTLSSARPQGHRGVQRRPQGANSFLLFISSWCHYCGL